MIVLPVVFMTLNSITITVVILIFLGGFIGWRVLVPAHTRLFLLRDQLSTLILVMTTILLIFILLASKPRSQLVLTFLSLMLILYVIITTTSIIIFYVWFELSLIPIVILILG